MGQRLLLAILFSSAWADYGLGRGAQIARPAANKAVFANGRVRLVVSIESNVYEYEVTNLGTDDIVGFEVETGGAFAIIPPAGWEKHISPEGLSARAAGQGLRISPGQTARFSLFGTGKDSVLGLVPVRLGLGSGQSLTIADVWGSVLEPRSYVALVAASLLAVLGIHTVITELRTRRGLGRVSH